MAGRSLRNHASDPILWFLPFILLTDEENEDQQG